MDSDGDESLTSTAGWTEEATVLPNYHTAHTNALNYYYEIYKTILIYIYNIINISQ